MKKIVIIAAVTFAAVAAQAQTATTKGKKAEVGFKAQPKVSAKAHPCADTLAKALERQVSRSIVKNQAQTAKHQKSVTAAKTPANTAKPATQKAVAQKDDSNDVAKWLKAIFLGGPLPGESADDYHTRLLAQSHPASFASK